VSSKIEQALQQAAEVTKKELQASDAEIDKEIAEAESEAGG
jgi:hypothetical protein